MRREMSEKWGTSRSKASLAAVADEMPTAATPVPASAARSIRGDLAGPAWPRLNLAVVGGSEHGSPLPPRRTPAWRPIGPNRSKFPHPTEKEK